MNSKRCHNLTAASCGVLNPTANKYRKLFVCCIIILFVNLNVLFAEEEENIVPFDNTFALTFSTKYNSVQFLQFDGNNLSSNRPLDAGLTVSYKDLSLGFYVSIPGVYVKEYAKSNSLDFQIDYFNDFAFCEVLLKYYDGFNNDTDAVDLQLFSGALLFGYIFNKQHHSLRSTYSLSRLQTKSSGSFLLGGNIWLSSIESAALNQYRSKIYYINFGPNIGYSYTWILSRGWFFSTFLTAGADICINKNTADWFFTPQIMPKITVGKHNDLWSVNFIVEANYLCFNKNNNRDFLFFGAASVNVTRRF
jgi:hypothetical protein